MDGLQMALIKGQNGLGGPVQFPAQGGKTGGVPGRGEESPAPLAGAGKVTQAVQKITFSGEESAGNRGHLAQQPDESPHVGFLDSSLRHEPGEARKGKGQEERSQAFFPVMRS